MFQNVDILLLFSAVKSALQELWLLITTSGQYFRNEKEETRFKYNAQNSKIEVKCQIDIWNI